MGQRSRVVGPDGTSPWPALWALVIGFFMILVDATIVTVATPALLVSLQADVNAVIWVTSAYLLAFAVPLLMTGTGPSRSTWWAWRCSRWRRCGAA